MTTALTIRGVNIASTTLSIANKAVTGTGGTATAADHTTIDTSTGYGELYAQGNSGAWAAAGAIGSPSGNGWLHDVTTLEGQQIIAGNWTPTFQLSLFNSSAGVDMYCRAYVYNAVSFTYTLIGSMSLTGEVIFDTTSTFVFSATALAATNFGPGDKLYYDFWLNITANNSASTNYVRVLQSSTNKGIANRAELVTPGYIVSPVISKDLKARLRLLMRSQRDLTTRLLLQIGTTALKNLSGRLRLAIPPRLDSKLRLRLRATQIRDVGVRLRLLSSTGFFVPLITFTPNTLILPADVNTNFSSLNQATTFTGPITHLISDGGQLTSTTAGGLLIGGQMGAVAYGDRIDVTSLPGNLILGSGVTGSGNVSSQGTAGSGFVMQIAGTTVGSISSAGFAGAGLTADTSINFQTGTIVKAIAFVGRDNGVYNHNMGFLPEFFGAMHTVPTSNQVALSAATSTQVTVTANFVASFICWTIEYS